MSTGTISTGKKQGYKAQLGVAATSSGSATLCATLKEVDWEIKSAKLDATDHSTAGWESSMNGLLSWSATAKLDFYEGDAQIALLRSSIVGNTPVYVSLYHEINAGSGEEVYQGMAIITSWKSGGKNNDLQAVDVSLEGSGPLVIGAQ